MHVVREGQRHAAQLAGGSGPAGLLQSAYQAAGPVLVRRAGDRDRTGTASLEDGASVFVLARERQARLVTDFLADRAGRACGAACAALNFPHGVHITGDLAP